MSTRMWTNRNPSTLLLLLLLSHISRVQLCATPQMEAHQAPPSLGFSRQEHWSGIGTDSIENNTKVSQKIKNRTTI